MHRHADPVCDLSPSHRRITELIAQSEVMQGMPSPLVFRTNTVALSQLRPRSGQGRHRGTLTGWVMCIRSTGATASTAARNQEAVELCKNCDAEASSIRTLFSYLDRLNEKVTIGSPLNPAIQAHLASRAHPPGLDGPSFLKDHPNAH